MPTSLSSLPRRRFFTALAALAAGVGPLRQTAAQEGAPIVPAGYVELHRLRVTNKPDGAVQVSADGGKTWRLLGRVLIAASTAKEGYIAAEYAETGTVAAVAVHGIRIRTSPPDSRLHAPRIVSLDPREYVAAANNTANKGYGGHRPGSAGIFLDIPAGVSVFCELAPQVGNRVYLESSTTGRLSPLPADFKPSGAGDILVIPVIAPADSLTQVVFENKEGGAVTATFAGGAIRRLTTVVKPVRGVGRFDGTAYTGVGRLNTAHTGVITVSTAPVDSKLPEGEGPERRGGFQISPVWHNARTEEAGAPMVMVVGSPGPERKRELEGTAPLFKEAIGLGWGSDADATGIVDCSIDGGPWEPLPPIVGARLDAFTGPGLTRWWKAKGIKRTAKQGVTAFRLRLPVLTPERAAYLVEAASQAYAARRLAAARRGEIPLVSGRLSVNANPTNAKNVAFVRLWVEGEPKGFTNAAPFNLTWDTTRYPDGEYLIEAEALDSGGAVLARTHRRVYVLNQPAPAKTTAAPE